MNVRALILAEYSRRKATPFVWGSEDCITFALDCAKLITGRDPLAHLRGTYSSEVGHHRVMVKEGWKDLGDVARSVFESIPVARAQSGDWALVKDDEGHEMIGVVTGSQVVARGKEALGIVPLTRAVEAFRVA